jgi:hypothetical protein
MFADHTRLIRYFAGDALHQLVALHYLKSHPHDVVGYLYETEPQHSAALLLLPIAISPTDRALYKTMQWVAVLSANHRDAAALLLPYIPQSQPAVIKCSDAFSRTALRNHQQARHTRSLISYTAPAQNGYSASDMVQVSARLDERCIPLWCKGGCDEQSIRSAFSSGDALAFTQYEQDEPVATCYAYPNYEGIWDVTGVYTVGAQPQRELGQAVMGTALHHLLGRKLTPHYQVEHSDHALIRLAELLRLQRTAQTDHFTL